MTSPDVSVIFNMHREGLLIAPTLESLVRCAQEARDAAVDVELVAVFDRPDAITKQVFHEHDLSAFSRVAVVEVDVGSLGLARNAGVAEAKGEYIWTSDADDLVSSNCIVAMLETARLHRDGKVAVFSEYLCAFGEQYHNVRYVDARYLTSADFALQHPYVSRIFLRRDAFGSVSYHDLRVTSGFAYEDWYFNCELRALGYDMVVAPDTVLFYRQRKGSLLRQANAASARLIPHSRLFDMDMFLSDMEQTRERVGSWGSFMRTRRAIFDDNNTASFMASEKLQGFLWDAIALEPEIEPQKVETAGSYTPVPWNPRHWGVQMENLYKMLGRKQFSDVVLLPWLNPGGAEKYILQVLNEICAQDPDAHVLVIAGQAAKRHDWKSELPSSSVFVDLYNAFPLLDVPELDAMLLRAMLATSIDGARLHLKSSPFAHRLLDAYGPVLFGKYRPIYYRFSDGTYAWKGVNLRGPWGVAVMRQHLHGFWKVVTDCRAISDADRPLLGPMMSKYETIYAKCQACAFVGTKDRPQRRLLWASRIAPEKRLDLLAEIASALQKAKIDVSIDVFGSSDTGTNPKQLLASVQSVVNYRGGFASFAEVRPERYDAFIYTTSFDGLPNVVLEALASGLPVVAPAIGGLPEVVRSGETGFLIEKAVDESTLVAGYVTAIEEIYRDWPKTMAMSINARRLVACQHGEHMFGERVRSVFIPKNAAEDIPTEAA